MSEHRSSSESHDSFNQHVVQQLIDDLFPDNISMNNPDYNRLYDNLKKWLSTTDIASMNEKAIQFNFYQNCMKVYNQQIGDTLKYVDDFNGIIYRDLFQRLMPDFCIVDHYNSHLKSLSSGLDLEFLPLHIVSIFELKKKLKDKDVGQLLHYLRIVLDYSPSSRTYIIGAITDFHDIRYAKVSRSDNDDNVKYETASKVIINENEYLLHYLTKFLTTNTSQFGYNRLEPLPKDIRIHDTLLGTGANSMVFNCLIDKHEPNQYALKISNKPVNREVLIYKQLYGDKYNIVKVHEYALLFVHPPGRIISKQNLLNNVDIIWEHIKGAHKHNILHRDIRKSNIIEILNHQTK
ncbi:unnamed protein product, partial [Didymodactylos carnosus]